VGKRQAGIAQEVATTTGTGVIAYGRRVEDVDLL